MAAAGPGQVCGGTVESDAPLELCTAHLQLAFDWVARETGVTDTLPSPCLACGSRLGVRYPSGWLCAICDWKVGQIPDDDIAVARVDVVYYIRFDDRIKIGTSGNPRSRLANFSTAELLAFERGDRRVEQRRHAQFKSHRFPRTEWFEVHDALLQHVESLRAGVSDPWEQYAFWVSQQIALRG
ncbi:MAG: ATPase [Glaciihabitans sp.]|nr:ATPase [Glaciihabitans sp.]